MSRFNERARIARVLSVVLASCAALGSLTGCEQLDGRNRTRQGNRLFRESQFIDAAAEYEKALTTVDDPIIHYNLGLAYSKIFKPGFEGPVLLGTKGEFVCQVIPGVKMVDAGACVKQGDRHFAECGASKTAPLEKELADLQSQEKSATDEEKQKDLAAQAREKQDEIGRYTCPSSFQCVESSFCSLTSPEIANLAAKHFQIWIKAQPSDDQIKQQLVAASKDLDDAKREDNKSLQAEAQRQIDDLALKDQTRKLMTQLWNDSEQFDKALEYWQSLLDGRPNDPEIMGNLAGINLKAGNWRKSIEWYNKVADVTADPSSKVAAYQFIGYLAWSSLNKRSLIGVESVELADRGIGALQRALELQPKNFRLTGLQGSLYNFRSTAHGASLASAIDRASAQDLSKLARVLSEEAKKAQGQPAGTPSAPATSPTAGAPAAQGTGSGSAAPAAPGTSPGSAAPAAAGSASGPAAPAAGSASGTAAPKATKAAAAAAPAEKKTAPAAQAPSEAKPAPAGAAPADPAPAAPPAPTEAPAPPTPPAPPATDGSAEKSGG